MTYLLLVHIPLQKALSQLKHIFRCSSGSSKLSALIPGVTGSIWKTMHFVQEDQIAEVFGVGKGLCHCLKILHKLGFSAVGKNVEPSRTCEVPTMWWKERDKMGKSQGKCTMEEKNNHKFSVLILCTQKNTGVRPKIQWFLAPACFPM